MAGPLPSPSTIELVLDGVDITRKVLFRTARLESQQNAIPGAWQLVVKDQDHTFSAVEGQEFYAQIDGTKVYGGYLFRINRVYPMPVMDTTDPDSVARYWQLWGLDYNVLFSKRVLRNPANYTSQIPDFTGDQYDGELITIMGENYLDVSDIDVTTFVDNIRPPFNGTPDSTKRGAWMQQGTQWRKQMEDFTQFTGALFYIDPDKNLHHHAIEDSVKRWGFSDTPNYDTITASPNEYQGATIGPREIDATESGEHFVNDAFVWGGSQWAGSGQTVFAREENTDSITDYGRWQLAETHFGETGYKLQEGVDVRADVIVNGPPGAVAADQNRGLRYPQWQFRMAWFAHHVPTLSGVRDHVLPGQLSTIQLDTFGDGVDPLLLLLPLRTVSISFPTIPSDNPDEEGLTYVRFDGFFGLQPDDPHFLWKFLLRNPAREQTPLTTVTPDSDGTVYGAFFQGPPSEGANGVRTQFSIPFGYISGTLQVYVNGVLQMPLTAYTESDPEAGEFTFVTAPASLATILVVCRTQAGGGTATPTPPPPSGGGGTGGTVVPATPGALAAAIAAASNGDTLTLRGGAHVLGSGLTGSPAFNYGGISTSKYLTIQNYVDETPVITWAAGVRNNGLYFTGSAGPIVVDGIVFQATSTITHDPNGSAMLESDGCDDLSVINCTFIGHSSYDDRQQLFYQRFGTNINCINCVFDANGSDGFGFHQYPEDTGGDPNCLVQGCEFSDFLVSGGVTSDSIITVDDCVFQNNNIGVQLRNGAVGSTITGNSGSGNDQPLQLNSPVNSGNITQSGNTWT